MKRVTASEARKNWFRLLDEVAAGDVVVIERNGQRIVLSRDTSRETGQKIPDYGDLLRVPDVDSADEWSWSWPPGGELQPEETQGE